MAAWKFLLLTGIGFLAIHAFPATPSEQNITRIPSNLEILNDSTSSNETVDEPMDIFFINNTEFSLLEEFTNESTIPEVLYSNSEAASNNDEYLNEAISTMSSTHQPIQFLLSTLFPKDAIHLTMAAPTETSKILESIGSSESNDIPLAGSTSWFVLILDGNCSLQGDDLVNLKDRLTDELVIRLGLRRWNLNVKDTTCSSSDQMHINITVSESCKNLSALLLTSLLHTDNLSSSRPLVRIEHHDYYVQKILTTDGFLVIVEPDMIPVDMRHSDVELIICIAVGSACAFLILLVAGLLTFKYCNTCCAASQKPTYFLDYHRDVLPTNSHLQNMHLEDYTLTRIPRPKLGYIDYCRGASTSKRYSPLGDTNVTEPNGMVQPFDTSVVPLEDAYGEAQCTDGVIVRPMDIRRYGKSITRFYRNGHGLKSPNNKSETSGSGEGSYHVSSTENLQVNDEIMDSGQDNPVYQH